MAHGNTIGTRAKWAQGPRSARMLIGSRSVLVLLAHLAGNLELFLALLGQLIVPGDTAEQLLGFPDDLVLQSRRTLARSLVGIAHGLKASGPATIDAMTRRDPIVAERT